MRTIKHIYQAPRKHWVGDGFHVSPLFSHMGEDKLTSPFLMLDYAMPMEFAPNSGAPRGVGSHPHAGFETVTVALQGEISHRDSSGGGGTIRMGDVQWMTAGHGIVHEEFHSEAFSRRGGMLEMLQFWVNLPRAFKNVPPAYQAIAAKDIPHVRRQDADVSVIAGRLGDTVGPAHTYSELNLWLIDIDADGQTEFDIPAAHNLLLVVLSGDILINGTRRAQPTELVSFADEAGLIRLQSEGKAAKLALISGLPIDEPVVGYGPFVMNTREEIVEKINAFKQGAFGRID